MKTTLIACLAFFSGLYFGVAFTYRACTRGIERAPIEAVAKRAILDVEQAYENQILKEDTLSRCLRQNSKLKSEKRKDQE